MTPLVSIALCTYNAGNYLIPLLESLQQQTWTNLEIVCCDDKSKDATVEKLEIFSLQHPGKVKIYVNDINLGYIKNFEKCLSLCSGSYIAIADQDDVWQSTKIETLMNAIGNAMMVYSDSTYIDKNGAEMGRKISDTFRLHDQPHHHAFIFYDFVWGHTTLLRKELLDLAFPVPAGMPYDSWLAYTAAATGEIRYVDKTLTGWRQHDHSFTAMTYTENTQLKDSPNRKYDDLLKKMERIQLLKDHPHCPDKLFMEKLYAAYGSLHTGFSWSLFFFLNRHQKTLFPVWRRGQLSRLNEFRKLARGVSKPKEQN